MLLIIIWYFFHNYFWPRPRPKNIVMIVNGNIVRLNTLIKAKDVKMILCYTYNLRKQVIT